MDFSFPYRTAISQQIEWSSLWQSWLSSSPVCSLSPLDSTSVFRSLCCIIWWSQRNRVCLSYSVTFLRASRLRISAAFATVDVSTHIQCRP